METHTLRLDEWQIRSFFGPIRTKRDTIKLLVNTVKLFLAPSEPPEDRVSGHVTVAVAKMSRLLYSLPNKSFSIGMPFIVRKSGNSFSFSSHACPSIDSKVTSDLIELLDDNDLFEKINVLDSIEPILEIGDFNKEIWPLLRDLILWEDGYLRYDHDPERANGHQHPLHHIDLFYSSGTSFKVGLGSTLDSKRFLDIVDIRTDCHYLRAPGA